MLKNKEERKRACEEKPGEKTRGWQDGDKSSGEVEDDGQEEGRKRGK